MKSNSSNGQLTAQINVKDQQKSGFDLSQNVLGTGKIGRIIPTRALHVMPGDTVTQDSKVAVQFEPLAVPILANMDVKQEHFYIPYNVVWKNWDKFISGGEKMDYVGVVPNVSLSRIMRMLCDKLGYTIDFGNVGSYSHSASSGYLDLKNQYLLKYFYYLREEYDYMEEYSRYVDIADFDQTKDIQSQVLAGIQEFYRALHFFVKENLDALDSASPDFGYSISSYIGIYSKDQLDRFLSTGFGPDITDTDVEEFDLILTDELANNKYIKEIYPALVNWLETAPIYMPYIDFLQVIEAFYEVFKPLVGLGSNIDYLNMGRVTKAEFIFSIIAGVSKYIGNVDEERGTMRIYEFAEFSNLPLSILNLRANYSVWYNNYRDILLETKAQEPVIEDEVTNDELFTLLLPRQRCWEKDMFTTALDSPGTGMVGVPVGLQGLGGFQYHSLYQNGINSSLNSFSDSLSADQNGIYEVSIAGQSWRVPSSFLTGINPKDDQSGEQTMGFSLYQLDAAQRAQKWLQKALYFGNRISDFYYLRYGVRFLDARLRLPELLTSSSELVKLDVLVNNTTTSESIAGDRAAYASAYDNGNSFKRFCEEHGVLLSYLTIMPQVTYAHGINRDYSRLDQFDYAFSEFATLGMDAVYDTEITASSVVVQPTGSDSVKPYVFGYQGKYYDYKAKHSEEHGELLDSQDMYTFSRKFNMFDPNGRPKLNYEFVHCFPALDMFVVDSPLADYFRYDIRHSTAAERGLPSQSIYI